MLELKPLQEADLEFVRQLRNANRSAFFDNRYILDWQQREWFHKYMRQSFTDFWIIVKDGFRVGTISKKYLGKFNGIYGYELGNLMLIESARGKGIMAWAVEQLRLPNTLFVAHVKQGNAASLSVFERAGFLRLKKGDFNASAKEVRKGVGQSNRSKRNDKRSSDRGKESTGRKGRGAKK